MGKNMDRFANVMAKRMSETAGASFKQTIDLATVDGNLGITPDSFNARIPKGSYLVNLALTSDMYTSYDGNDNDGWRHRHTIPSEFRGLKEGDRVLIAWCGYTPVIIAIVV